MEKPENGPGKLVLIIGPSGVGKSAIMKRLRASHPEFHSPRSATTRPRREGEDDKNYHFVTNDEFDALIAGGKVLEWAIVHGKDRYGTIHAEIIPPIEAGKTVLREVDVQGFVSIQNSPIFRDGAHRLQSIFILPLPVPIPAPWFALGYLAYTVFAARANRGRVNHDAHLSGALAGIAFVGLTDPAALTSAVHFVFK